MITPSRPYLIRALYQWILDNGCTPYILVDAMLPGVQVPFDHISECGKIVLNISPTAVPLLDMANEGISLEARFSGIPKQLYVPIYAIQSIYAKENGQGMVFGEEAGAPDPNSPPPGTKVRPLPPGQKGNKVASIARARGPHLKVVK